MTIGDAKLHKELDYMRVIKHIKRLEVHIKHNDIINIDDSDQEQHLNHTEGKLLFYKNDEGKRRSMMMSGFLEHD